MHDESWTLPSKWLSAALVTVIVIDELVVVVPPKGTLNTEM